MHTRPFIPQPKNKKRPVASPSSNPSVTEELPGTYIGPQIPHDVVKASGDILPESNGIQVQFGGHWVAPNASSSGVFIR